MLRTFLRLAAHTQMLPILESGEETLVGGQAVMEGVMMRAPHSYCVSVRRANGEVFRQEAPLAKVSEKYPIFKYPVFRGVGVLGQAMWLGMKSLKFSADVALEDEQAKEEKSEEPRKAKKDGKEKKSGEMPGWLMAVNLAFSIGFFIFLYKLVPLYLTTLLGKSYPVLEGRILFNLVDGIIRIALFLGFLYLISRWKDVRRVFEYHGAEHKVVFNFESGEPLTVANAQKFVTFHPRCGTSFLMVVMVVAIVVYTLVPADTFLMKFLARIALLPVIAGLSYEAIRFAAKRRKSLMAVMTTPGLWLQRITTQPPSDDQTAVAINALEYAMVIEKEQGGQLIVA